ncbi:MAG: HypC/HybG/HupF family hydrogenase formation chaperone [Solirubrobacteraceae bacterium]
MVRSVRGSLVLVELAGIQRWANALMYPEIEAGDSVLIHAGLVVNVLTADEARDIEAALAELGVLAD